MAENGHKNGLIVANPMTYGLLREKAVYNRQHPTDAERALWDCLRSRFSAARFRNQYVIDEYIVDFVAMKKRLIIEVDGDYHYTEKQQEKDHEREMRLRKMGFRITRFTNNDVLCNMEKVVQHIKSELY